MENHVRLVGSVIFLRCMDCTGYLELVKAKSGTDAGYEIFVLVHSIHFYERGIECQGKRAEESEIIEELNLRSGNITYSI